MLRAMNSAISGLRNHQTMMDVVSNNIANINTTGFKSSRVTFQTMLTQTLRGAIPGAIGRGGQDSVQIGLGMSVAGVDKLNTQGVLSSTSKITDMAIAGDGYFIMTDGNKKYYSRDGAFDLDSTGALISPSSGLRVNGWMASTNAAGQKVINSAMPPSAPLVIPLGQGVNAKQTGQVSFNGNLNGASTDLLGSGVIEDSDIANIGKVGFAVSATDTVTFNYGGVTYTTGVLAAATKGTTPIATLASDLQAKMQAAGGAATAGITVTVADATSVAGDATLVFKGPKALSFGSSPSSALDLGAVLKGRSSTGLETMTTSFVAYDTLGMSHEVTVKFEKQVAGTAVAGAGFAGGLVPNNTWKWSVANLDPGTNIVPWSASSTGGTDATGYLTFDNGGKFQSVSTIATGGTTPLTGARIALSFPNGQAQGQPVILDFARMSQLQDGNTVSAVENDGNPTGTLTSFTVGSDGKIVGAYSNGVQEELGQVALATFSNPGGLLQVTQNLVAASANSGIPQVGIAGTGSRGQINNGQLELSNVDLSVQFTDMIRAERGFQANSRIITTSDEMLQDLVNLKR